MPNSIDGQSPRNGWSAQTGSSVTDSLSRWAPTRARSEPPRPPTTQPAYRDRAGQCSPVRPTPKPRPSGGRVQSGIGSRRRLSLGPPRVGAGIGVGSEGRMGGQPGDGEDTAQETVRPITYSQPQIEGMGGVG